MRGEGHGALSAAMIRLMNTKRTEFTTASEFIDAVKQRYKTANDLKADFSPYTAIVIMVSQLQEISELRSSIEIRNNEMKNIKDPIKEITINDFFKYCADMQDKIKEFGIDGGLGASAIKASRQPQDKLMNAPPPGKYAKKHVEDWRNYKTQRTANGACSYCGTQGHDAKDCYQLIRETRPPNWKPKPGLWYWKTYDNKPSEFNENKSQQFTGKPSERTRQANFDAVASSATSSDNKEYDFGGMAIAESEADLDQQASYSQQATEHAISQQATKHAISQQATKHAISQQATATRQLRSGIGVDK
jgi:hypothetical protein